jgi:cytochrome c-type biogenesis protein CcmE
MAEINWEKTPAAAASAKQSSPSRLKFMVVGLAMLAAVAALLISGTAAGGRYFITVDSLMSRPDLVGKTVKITGAVIGSTIQNDSAAKAIRFTMANLTDDMQLVDKQGGLAGALHLAVTDAAARKLDVVVANQPMPDLLQNEAQAILTGKLGADGVFYADEILLKCPSKYQSELPKQST